MSASSRMSADSPHDVGLEDLRLVANNEGSLRQAKLTQGNLADTKRYRHPTHRLTSMALPRQMPSQKMPVFIRHYVKISICINFRSMEFYSIFYKLIDMNEKFI